MILCIILLLIIFICQSNHSQCKLFIPLVYTYAQRYSIVNSFCCFTLQDVSAAVAQTSLPYQSIAVNHIKNDFWRASHSTVLKRESSKTISDFHPSERAIIHPRTRRFRQPAFAKPVYSFQVNEDTLPGRRL